MIVVIIWLQHIFLKVCISILAEKELTKLHAPSIPLFEFVLQKLNLTFEHFTNYFLTAETVCVLMFTLEMLSKLSVEIHKDYGIVY